MNNTISVILDDVKVIFDATQAILEPLPLGERIQLKDLAQKVATSLNLDLRYVLPFVTHFARKTDLVYVTRGKKGGIIRGSKPSK